MFLNYNIILNFNFNFNFILLHDKLCIYISLQKKKRKNHLNFGRAMLLQNRLSPLLKGHVALRKTRLNPYGVYGPQVPAWMWAPSAGGLATSTPFTSRGPLGRYSCPSYISKPFLLSQVLCFQ